MACFTVPVAEAIVTTIVAKAVKSKEEKQHINLNGANTEIKESGKTPFSKKLGWLNKMLWLGSFLLAFEHLWHGEVIPTFPFLTAVKTGEVSEMLGEMATAGVMMAVLVTLVWAGIVAVVTVMEKKADKEPEIAEENA